MQHSSKWARSCLSPDSATVPKGCKVVHISRQKTAVSVTSGDVPAIIEDCCVTIPWQTPFDFVTFLATSQRADIGARCRIRNFGLKPDIGFWFVRVDIVGQRFRALRWCKDHRSYQIRPSVFQDTRKGAGLGMLINIKQGDSADRSKLAIQTAQRKCAPPTSTVPGDTGRPTVPISWDERYEKILSNASTVKILTFCDLSPFIDLLPDRLSAKIEALAKKLSRPMKLPGRHQHTCFAVEQDCLHLLANDLSCLIAAFGPSCRSNWFTRTDT